MQAPSRGSAATCQQPSTVGLQRFSIRSLRSTTGTIRASRASTQAVPCRSREKTLKDAKRRQPLSVEMPGHRANGHGALGDDYPRTCFASRRSSVRFRSAPLRDSPPRGGASEYAATGRATIPSRCAKLNQAGSGRRTEAKKEISTLATGSGATSGAKCPTSGSSRTWASATC